MSPSSKIPHRAIMSLGRHVRHSRRCGSLTSEANGSTESQNGGNTFSVSENKVSNAVNILDKAIMSMNQWKIISQLKELLSKYNSDKNIQIIFNRDWIEFFQKLTYSQIEAIRKFSLIDNVKVDQNASTKTSGKVEETVMDVAIPKKEEITTQHMPKQDFAEQSTAVLKTTDLRDQMYTLPQMISALIPRLTKAKVLPLTTTPKWKSNIQGSVSKQSIISRTRHILNSITVAESSISKLRRIEDLLAHLDQYPESRHHAIREGAIGILLNTRCKTKSPEIKASIKEGLALLGYVDPLPGRGIRILSIDGGGIRGILVIEMLKKLEELTGKQVYEMFDYICGVSTGAILSGVLGGNRKKSLKEISELYKEMSTKVFTQSALRGTSSLVWSHAYYDTALWEKLLKEQIGDMDLIKTVHGSNSPKFSAVSTVVNHSHVMAYVFRNYTLPQGMESQYIGSHKHKLWEIARASAAAPSYFEEYKCGEYLHQDGGIMVNNPCAVAVHEAKQLWPDNPIQCVISCGTGRAPYSVNCFTDTTKELAGASSWKDKFFKILDSATDTEAVHTTLNDLLPDHVYFRFNPYLTEMLSMVEIRPEKLMQLEQDAHMYIRRNDEKFQTAAKALTEKRKISQKISDWIALQKQIYFPTL